MEMDKMSIASDFSIIPESMINGEENETAPLPMLASFFRSEHSSEASATSSSPFMKVTFYAVEKMGPKAQAPLSVIFSVADDFAPKSSDRIALYKVGFSSSKDFLCYKWAPAPCADSDSTHPFTVIFEADILPSDTEELYQICYLMQNGKISGVSSPFQLKQTERSETNEIIEKAARNVLSIRVNELLKENEELREKLRKKSEELAAFKADKSHLESELQSLEVGVEERKKMIKTLKEFAIEKELSLEKVTQEVLEKEKEINQEKALTKEMEEKLCVTVLSMNELKDSLASTEQEKSITQERQEVLIQDNKDLKETLTLVKEELKNSLKEKAAAEKIASDLSQHLQSACSEYQNMTVMNAKLTKKVKKLRRAIALMEVNTNDDWLCVEEVGEDKKEEQEDNPWDEEDKVTEAGPVAASMTSSGVVATSACASTSCSQHLTETVSSVRKMMDDIVAQLSLQTEEMKSLKKEIVRRNEPQKESTAPVVGEEGIRAEVNLEETRLNDPKGSSSSEEDKRVIYGNSFLPAHCTAPVFLPTSATVSEPSHQVVLNSRGQLPMMAPSAPSPTPTMMNEEEAALPAPLLPETTTTARNAAVLCQFSDSNPLLTLDGVQQAAETTPEGTLERRPLPQESDDEDYHSTGDVGEPAPTQHLPGILRCPLCPLEFMPKAIRLMEEHINNHLDRTCPVCSLAFQRNILQKTFEDHVQSHFDDGAGGCEQNYASDSSGPWDPRDPRRSFQLLEID